MSLTYPLIETWRRRALTIPGVFVLLGALVAFFPVLLLACVVWDLYRHAAFVRTRTLFFAIFHAACECMGLVAAFGLWLLSGTWLGLNRERFLYANFRLQCLWGMALARTAIELFGIRVAVERSYAFGERPVIVFIQHSSYADTLLPVLLISAPHGIRLRYILKHALLWDPCLDVVGNRLPNHFVRRGSGDTRAELARVAALMNDLGPNEGVLLYPEGTRFTMAKRTKYLQQCILRRDDEGWMRAQRLKHVLPPRLGGALALLEANTGADAVFVAHTGLESALSQAALLRGALIGATVRARIWGVPYEAIPTEREARILWLHEQWEAVDAFVAENQPEIAGNDAHG